MTSLETRKRRLASVVAVLLLALGVLAGIGADRLLLGARPRHGGFWQRQRPAAQVELLRDRLGLDAAQTAAVQPIVERRWQAMRGALGRMAPEMDAARAQARGEVAALLTPAQASAFAELNREEDERRDAMRRDLGSP